MKSKNTYSLKEAIESMIERYRLTAGLTEIEIRESWDAVMGGYIAKKTQSIILKNSTLTITLNSSELKHELHFGKEKIISLMNEALGREAVKYVQIR